MKPASILSASFLMLVVAASANAQSTRTWVSGVGDDSNPCSRTAPCKTFAGAIAKTNAGGEIDALDPGDFGTVTINKAIVIDGGGTLGGIVASGSTTNGVIISAGATDTVTLRNISIDGVGTGAAGVLVNSAGAVHIEKSVIFGFVKHGVYFIPTGTANLTINDTTVRDCVGGSTGRGAAVEVNAASGSSLALSNFDSENCQIGLLADTSQVAASQSRFNGGSIGVSSTGSSFVVLDNVFITGNTTGVTAAAGSTMQVGSSSITANGTGVGSGGGTLASYGDNKIKGNTATGSFTSMITTR